MDSDINPLRSCSGLACRWVNPEVLPSTIRTSYLGSHRPLDRFVVSYWIRFLTVIHAPFPEVAARNVHTPFRMELGYCAETRGI